MTSAYKRGLASEHACISKLILAGYSPCIPATGGESYDLVVVDGKAPIKIQVKSTRSRDYNKYEVFVCKGNTDKRSYTEDEVDYFCVHIVPEDCWFIIPRAATKDRKKIRIDPYCPDHEFWAYKDDWSLGGKAPIFDTIIEPLHKKRGRELPVWSMQ